MSKLDSFTFKYYRSIEVSIIVIIIALLASIFWINVSKWRAGARDSQRTSSIRTIQQGLAFYFYRSEYSGAYPVYDGYITGSDTPSKELRASGAMATLPLDPINSGKYRYYYCSLMTNCSALRGNGTNKPDGTSYILMYYLESSAVIGKNKGQNFSTP